MFKICYAATIDHLNDGAEVVRHCYIHGSGDCRVDHVAFVPLDQLDGLIEQLQMAQADVRMDQACSAYNPHAEITANE